MVKAEHRGYTEYTGFGHRENALKNAKPERLF